MALEPAEHCGHVCCDIPYAPHHDHFLGVEECGACTLINEKRAASEAELTRLAGEIEARMTAPGTPPPVGEKRVYLYVRRLEDQSVVKQFDVTDKLGTEGLENMYRSLLSRYTGPETYVDGAEVEAAEDELADAPKSPPFTEACDMGPMTLDPAPPADRAVEHDDMCEQVHEASWCRCARRFDPPNSQRNLAVEIVARRDHDWVCACGDYEAHTRAVNLFRRDAERAIDALRQALSGPHGREVAEGLGMAVGAWLGVGMACAGVDRRTGQPTMRPLCGDDSVQAVPQGGLGPRCQGA